MRTVPRSPSLNPALRKCSTNSGKSVEPVSGDHSTACPFSPAIEVNVPHSCAVNPEKTAGVSDPVSPAEIGMQLAKSAQDIARKEFIFMAGPPEIVNDLLLVRCYCAAIPDANRPATVNTGAWVRYGKALAKSLTFPSSPPVRGRAQFNSRVPPPLAWHPSPILRLGFGRLSAHPSQRS